MYDYMNNLLVADGFLNAFKDAFILNFINENRYMFILKGLLVTVEITFFATLVGVIIGFVVALAKLSNFKIGNIRVLNILASTYINVVRGTPAVVQLLIIYYIIFGSVDISKIVVAILAFGINSGAYVAEIIRAGILAVDRGQMEAGRSLGLSYGATMRYIILPQAIKNILPALGNEFIVLLKETAIAGYIAIEDLTKGGDIIRSRTFDPYMPLLTVAVMYLILTTVLSKFMDRLERRMRQGDSH
ncbi:amino acid ABC transporter permease [Petroclostridium sp. X23]|jgi:His/Glu/Gln/Arg/opine family amino acid ABC transporter permease subunit|uniref:amino acid ABC transporter permease n=1 Tax=Petroclostridium sp. X23 TaxID=3045146 RepID=UPI0024AD1853|nr:amino acid ABC transporter permease [Petroclostridium sp. X23]WHH61413.1 amino acid ABC transporter permease [Petroclostridium sp. X23]